MTIHEKMKMQQTQLQSGDKGTQVQQEDGMQKSVGNEKIRASIGVNLRVTGHCQQGGRKYMEDYFAVAYQQTDDEKDLEYAFFGIFDGHGGAEAAAFAKEHLMEFIVKDPRFWFDDDADVLQSIKDGFMDTHQAMWRIHDKWPKTASGLPSTAGTTASVAFIRRGKIYIGHVGDSGITLGYQTPNTHEWHARSLTKDHKPESEDELARIEQSGGKVISKMGVPRVVWNRPRIGHKGPVRRSTPIDEIPFLAVARSLGDLWSYNATNDQFVVSPKPDVAVIPIDTATFRCLIFGTDGLYNMLSPQMAVHIVQEAEHRNEEATLSNPNPHWINPSKTLVERALDRWCNTKMRADNTSVITLMLDPPGPPRAQVLRTQRIEKERLANLKSTTESSSLKQSFDEKDTISGIGEKECSEKERFSRSNVKPAERIKACFRLDKERHKDPLISNSIKPLEERLNNSYTTDTTERMKMDGNTSSETHVKETFAPKLRESIPYDPRSPQPHASTASTGVSNTIQKENDIQINEITSSSFEEETKKKKKAGKMSKMHIMQRKFNLRSTNVEESTKKKKETMVVQEDKDKRKHPRAPLGENVPETSRLSPGTTEYRVLRDRRNTTPNSHSQDKNFKKKGVLPKKKGNAISTEKKKLLQTLLFKNNKDATTSSNLEKPKTKENQRKTPPKRMPPTGKASSPCDQRRSVRTKVTESPREMRKSTLKLRMPEGIFKAKLRTPSKMKLKKKAKGLYPSGS